VDRSEETGRCPAYGIRAVADAEDGLEAELFGQFVGCVRLAAVLEDRREHPVHAPVETGDADAITRPRLNAGLGQRCARPGWQRRAVFEFGNPLRVRAFFAICTSISLGSPSPNECASGLREYL